MKKKNKPTERPPAPTRYEFETFRAPGAYEVGRMRELNPYCFNGIVAVRKWKITFEQIDEPKEIVIERLLRLWGECDNHHNWGPLQAVGKSLGIELDFKTVGKLRKAEQTGEK